MPMLDLIGRYTTPRPSIDNIFPTQDPLSVPTQDPCLPTQEHVSMSMLAVLGRIPTPRPTIVDLCSVQDPLSVPTVD